MDPKIIYDIPMNYPPALAKAVEDEFEYALQLINGPVIVFERAETINAEWVRLKEVSQRAEDGFAFLFPCERGLEVRVSQIAWCADAPFGG